MDSWTQWPSLLVPHPNPRLFNGKKRSIYRLTAPLKPCNCSLATSFMPSVTDIFRKKDIPENHTQSLKPPPRIQPLFFESEPILDLAAEIAPLIAVKPPYVHGTDHAVSENNPNDGLMSNPRGHSKVNKLTTPHPLAFVRAVTPTSISAKMPGAPSTPSNQSFDSVPTMDEIAKSDTPLDKISFLSSSIVRRVSRRMTRKRTSERALNPKSQSSLSGTRDAQTPASACTTPSICSFVHSASPLPTSTHLAGTDDTVSSSTQDLIITSIAPHTRYSPQGTTNSQVCGEIQAPNQIGTTSSFVQVQTPNQSALQKCSVCLKNSDSAWFADANKEVDEVISELPTRCASVSMLFRHFSLSDRTGSPLPSEGSLSRSRSIGARRPRKGWNSQDIAKTYAYNSTSDVDTRKAGQDQGSPPHYASLSLSQLMTGTAPSGSMEEGRKEIPLNPAVESGILVASNSTGSTGMARWRRRGRAKVSGLGSVDERALVKGMTHPQTGLGTSPTAVFAINLSEEPLPTTPHIRENGYTTSTSFHSFKDPLANNTTTECQDTDVTTNGTHVIDGGRVSKTKNIEHKARAKFTIGDDDEHGVFEFPVRKRIDDDSLPNFAQQTDATAGGYEGSLPLVRSGVHISEERLGRRWSLANALIDERISDAGLMKEMERIRDVAVRRRETRRDEPEEMGWDELDVRKVILGEWDDEVMDGEGQRDMEENTTLKGAGANGHSGLSESPPSEEGKELLCDTGSSITSRSGTFIPKRHFRTTALHTRSSSAPSHSWLVAQRILFICRELILTERHYLTLLSALVHEETASPPPTLMLQYAEELVQVSEGFLKGMEKEPSAGGVAMAFLVKEEEMEEIYVKWCGVVGDWFTGDGGAGKDDGSLLGVGVELSERVNGRGRSQSSIKKGRMGHKTDGEDNGNSFGGDREEASASSVKRTVSTWRKSVQSISSLGFEVGSIYGMGVRKRDRDRDRDRDSDKEDEQTENKSPPPVKKPTIRELAILPTQRVMRYPLHYQELLSHIPPSSSHALVERAAHSACRIAGKCDRAQGNTAFIISSPFSGVLNATSRNSSRRPRQRPPKISTALSVQVTVESSVDRSSPTGADLGGSPVVSTFLSKASLSKASPPNSPKSSRGIGSTNSRPRRLSKPFMSLGWGKSNRLSSSPAEDVQALVTSSPVSNEF